MNLGSDKRQNIQMELDFSSKRAGEAREARGEVDEARPAMNEPGSPASTNGLMEEVCERENLMEALRRVKANKGSAGVDGMTVGELTDYLKQHWPTIREQLLSGTYEPKPVRRMEIPKPDGGGVRKLAIPSVLDRFIQQAVMQVLQRQWDRTFSDHSYGFRPGRSAHQAVAQPQARKFLGFSFSPGPEVKRVIAPKALARFKRQIREIMQRAKSVSMETTIEELAPYMRGWRSYFGFCETPVVLEYLTRWVRLRLRAPLCRQWKTPRRRKAALLALGVRPRLASNTAGSQRGPWYLARAKALSVGFSNAYFKSLGLPSLIEEG